MTKRKSSHGTTHVVNKAHIVMAASGFDDGGRVDGCMAKVTSDTIVVQRGYQDFQIGLVLLANQLMASGQFDTIGVLDIVGHGSAGALEVGIDQWMTPDENYQDCLVSFNIQTGNLITADTIIRLLGCNTGGACAVPLLTNGDGPVLALSLARRLGCHVHVTNSPINECQFTATGFRCDALLVKPSSMQLCTLVPAVAQNPDNIACASTCSGATSPGDLGGITATLKYALRNGVIADSHGHMISLVAMTDSRLEHEDAVGRLWLQEMTGLLARPGPAFALAFVLDDAPDVLMLALEGWHDGKPMVMLRKVTADGRNRLYWLRFDAPGALA